MLATIACLVIPLHRFSDALPITNLRCLEVLDFTNCPKVTDESATQFMLLNLRKLHLQSNQGLIKVV